MNKVNPSRKIFQSGQLMEKIDQIFGEKSRLVDNYIREHFQSTSKNPAILKLLESMKYSTYGGGKRFRPVLSLLTAETLGRDSSFVLPFGTAIEFIHCYSLIHDDLPAMDNDDFRRGRPSNHKVFGEAIALLAGDALLTESIYLLSKSYANQPQLILPVLTELTESVGVFGMAGGQAIDVFFEKSTSIPEIEIKEMHRMKTGKLIKMAVKGSALLCGATKEQTHQLELFGDDLGLAFQIADDLLDKNSTDEPNYSLMLGEQKALNDLDELSSQALDAIAPFGPKGESLGQLVHFNRKRTKLI